MSDGEVKKEDKYANAQRFRQILVDREITHTKLYALIVQYAGKYHFSPTNINILARSIREGLADSNVSDIMFTQALEIIGYSSEEIKATVI